MTPLVACDGLGRAFGSGAAAVVAVHDVTCAIAPGDRIALSGPSGSGKSTLLQLLAGLDRPTRGTVAWPGLDAELRSTTGIWQPSQIGLVFQSESLLPALTSLENVALPLLLGGLPRADVEADARAALQQMGLSAIERHLPDEISGGQAQRLAVARVLAARPRLLLADEPTGRLDQVLGDAVVGALLDTATALDAAIVVATHDPHVIERFSTRWRMNDGTVEPRQPRTRVSP